MRFATQIPPEITTIIAQAGEDTSSWPTINRPAPVPEPDYRYDDHMDRMVPNIPLGGSINLQV